jgi:hypothetical protein
MNRLTRLALALVLTVNAIAASKDSGQTALKDLQPVGVTDKKHKNQQYDILFVVGSDLAYVPNGNKAKLKGSSGKR